MISIEAKNGLPVIETTTAANRILVTVVWWPSGRFVNQTSTCSAPTIYLRLFHRKSYETDVSSIESKEDIQTLFRTFQDRKLGRIVS